MLFSESFQAVEALSHFLTHSCAPTFFGNFQAFGTWVITGHIPLADISLAVAPVILPYGSPTPDTSVRSPRTSPTIGGRFSLFVLFAAYVINHRLGHFWIHPAR